MDSRRGRTFPYLLPVLTLVTTGMPSSAGPCFAIPLCVAASSYPAICQFTATGDPVSTPGSRCHLRPVIRHKPQFRLPAPLGVPVPVPGGLPADVADALDVFVVMEMELWQTGRHDKHLLRDRMQTAHVTLV